MYVNEFKQNTDSFLTYRPIDNDFKINKQTNKLIQVQAISDQKFERCKCLNYCVLEDHREDHCYFRNVLQLLQKLPSEVATVNEQDINRSFRELAQFKFTTQTKNKQEQGGRKELIYYNFL